MNKEEVLSAAAAGTFKIGGDLTVNRTGLWCDAHHWPRSLGPARR